MTVRDATFMLLRAMGVTTVFGNPGSTELSFLRDFPEDFTYVLALHEAAAIGMAEGWAHVRQVAAFANLHTAAGLGNAMGAIVTAAANRTPMVVTAGQQDRRHLIGEPRLAGRLTELAGPYVKWAYQPARAEDVPEAIARGYHRAMSHPAGPVLVAVPMDDWDATVAGPPEARTIAYRTAPDPAILGAIEGVLRDALDSGRRVALVTGPGVARSRAWRSAAALADGLGADVWIDPAASRIGFPLDHPRLKGFLAPARRVLSRQLAPYDVVVVLGAPVFQYYAFTPGRGRAATTYLQITDNPEEASHGEAGLVAVGDVGLALERLDLVHRGDRGPGRAGRRARPRRLGPPSPGPHGPGALDTGFLMATLSARVPVDTVITEEAPSSKAEIHRYLPVSGPDAYLTTASGGLGYALPCAIGIKLAAPARPVLCVVGDGSAMYAWQALWTAAAHGLRVPIVVVNNREYRTLKAFGDLLGLAAQPPGLDIPGIDFVQMATALGCGAERVTRPEELSAAVDRLFRADGPYVLEVVVEPDDAPLFGIQAEPSIPSKNRTI